MPVNMDPTKKRRGAQPATSMAQDVAGGKAPPQPNAAFGTETDEDREKALADAESKNLWDATEVIDMDTV